MEITLPPDVEAALTERAEEQGTTPELLAVDTLRERFTPKACESAFEQPLSEYIRDHIGFFHSSELVPDATPLSRDIGKRFAAGMAEKRRRGRL